MTQQILTWWLVVEVLGVVALPLTALLFGALPDRGYAFGKALGLLLVGYVAWLLAMLGLAPFGAPLLAGCALLVGVVGVLATPAPTLRARFEGIGGWLRANWRTMLIYEALFLVALVFMALVRSYNPNPWGTERPMDFAFFNAIRRSDVFPPHDPWLSGFSINYYYFGYLLMAAVSLLSGIGPEASFSLALALVWALAALGVAGVVRNLAVLSLPQRAPTRGQAGGVWATALLAVVLVLFAGNQTSALQVASGTKIFPALSGGDQLRALQNGLGARQPLTLSPPFKGYDFSDTQVVTPTNMLKEFDTWYPSRALWDSFADAADPTAQPSRLYAITEFPAFSFWLGDMHPHVMALPFGLLALALALQTVVRSTLPRFARGWRNWLELVLIGVVLGSLYLINSWDFPSYLLLFAGALLLLHWRVAITSRVNDENRPAEPPSFAGSALHFSAFSSPRVQTVQQLRATWWWQAGVQIIGVAVAALVLFLPFFLTFHSLVGSKAPLTNLPLLGGLTRTIGFVTWDKTAIHTFLIIFGLFVLPLLGYVGVLARRIAVPRLLLWIALAAVPVGILIHFPLLFLLPLALYCITLATATAEQPVTAFVLWVFALGCLICFGTEIVYLRDLFENRMNTIFKFYYQLWLLWGVLAAYAAWWLAVRSKNLLAAAPVLAVAAALLACALIYPWQTIGRAFREQTPTGLVGQTPRQDNEQGAEAIAWLRANAQPRDVVLEAVGGDYDGALDTYPGGLGAGGVSASTGLPNIINWPGSHESVWRAGEPTALDQLGARQQDVKTIYSTTDVTQARDLLNKYQVRYIYVGAAERAAYPAEGLAKLIQLGTPVFPQASDVILYKVNG